MKQNLGAKLLGNQNIYDLQTQVPCTTLHQMEDHPKASTLSILTSHHQGHVLPVSGCPVLRFTPVPERFVQNRNS